MSVYNIISKNSITTPFIQFYKEQQNIIDEINTFFMIYYKNNRFQVSLSVEDSKKIKSILDSKTIIFNNEKIILFNFVELLAHDTPEGNQLLIKVLHPANKEYLQILIAIHQYYNEFLQLMLKWRQLFTKFNGIEFIHPINEINGLKEKILTGNVSETDKFIIPFYEHFKKYLTEFSELLSKDVDSYYLYINFYTGEYTQNFKYDVVFFDGEENHILVEGVKEEKTNIDNFLKNLFFYGKL